MVGDDMNKSKRWMLTRLITVQVNVNYNHETSSNLGIRSMPTFLFYVLGKKKFQVR